MGRFVLVALAGAGAAIAAHEEARAQTQSGLSVYLPEAFAQAGSANAYELLQRLPGFSLIEAEGDVRGYAGARGNVLIDGARPASKQDSIETLLRRIPVSAVERIELIRSVPGVDMAGHAVVANVVRIDGAGTLTVAEAGMGANALGHPIGHLSASRTSDSGGRSLGLSILAERAPRNDTGDGVVVVSAPDGTVLSRGDLDMRRHQDAVDASVQWSRPLLGGRLGLNGALRGERDESDERLRQTVPTAETVSNLREETYQEAEFSALLNRTFGATTTDLLISQRMGRSEATSERVRPGAQRRFQERADTTESIARLDINRPVTEAVSLSASVEGAFNRLEGASALTLNGAAVVLPGSDVLIDERRGELATGALWRLSQTLSLDAGVAVEASTILQSGDSPLERDFSYIKPRATAAWRPGDRSLLRLSVQREVGQLDFDAFLATATLNTGQVSAGNAELAPDQTWSAALSWERSFWDDGAVTVTYTHDRIQDVVDRVIITDGAAVFDAPGNIGEGRRDTLEVRAASSLDRLGVEGLRLSAWGVWRDSDVTDPVTAQGRPISGEARSESGLELTRALPAPRLNWGARVEFAEREVSYRFDEIATERDGLFWSAYVERRLAARWVLRAETEFALGRRFEESRRLWDGARNSAPLAEIEERRHTSPGRFMIVLRRDAGL